MKIRTLTLKTPSQAAIFVLELKGQLSDGMWENASPNGHWKHWSNAYVLVGDNVGRDFYASKDNYNFASKMLIEIVGDRMIHYAKMANAGYSITEIEEIECLLEGICEGIDIPEGYSSAWWDKKRAQEKALKDSGEYTRIQNILRNDSYGEKQLRADLREIKKAVKIQK